MRNILTIISLAMLLLSLSCGSGNGAIPRDSHDSDSSDVYNDSIYVYMTDTTVYVFPVGKDAFISGILDNNKSMYELIEFYTKECYDFYGEDLDVDYDRGSLFINNSSDGPTPQGMGDTLLYLDIPRTEHRQMELFGLAIWRRQLDVGGFRVGDPIRKFERLFKTKISSDINKIVIVNHTFDLRDWPDLRKIEESANLQFPKTPNIWEDLPSGGIEYIIRDNMIERIVSTDWSRGDYFW